MPTLQQALAGPAPKTLAEVIARMRAIEVALPERDGVAWFTRLYLAVTENVQSALKPRVFADPRFLERLDVVFANLFFAALAKPPRAWAPLIACRAQPDTAPIQFALCGMNAHINRDLPVALVRTATQLGVDLGGATREHRDFTKINAVLAATEAAVKREFATGIVHLADDVLGKVDDRIAMWDVGRAREAAWVQGQILWRLRDLPPLAKRYLDTLDRTVGFAGRGLLVPL
ncbi:MAG: DUF5995 family protein [Gaiellaceae bacterium]